MQTSSSIMAIDIIETDMLQIGDQFDQYQILGHIAKGGMSDIYRAYDLVNRRDVAIKIPDASIMGDPAQFERFQRELEVLNTLDHPAILKGLGSGRYNRIPYLVTAYLEGKSLRDMISEGAPLPPDQAAEHRAQDRRRHGLLPRQRHHPPRPQARKYHRSPARASR